MKDDAERIKWLNEQIEHIDKFYRREEELGNRMTASMAAAELSIYTKVRDKLFGGESHNGIR